MEGDTPKYFYVSAIEDGKFEFLLAGPYLYYAVALVMVEHINRVACNMDPRAAFAAFGTAGNNDRRATPFGVALVRPVPAAFGVVDMDSLNTHRAWYVAMHRLTGYTPEEHCATHYPGQYHMASVACRWRCREITARVQAKGIDTGKVLIAMKEEPQTLYAAGWRTPDGAMHYFDGPTPSLNSLRTATPPCWRCWHHPESSCYFVTTDDAEVKLMFDTADGAHCIEIECNAYLVRLEEDNVTPVARWDGAEWKKKKLQ